MLTTSRSARTISENGSSLHNTRTPLTKTVLKILLSGNIRQHRPGRRLCFGNDDPSQMAQGHLQRSVWLLLPPLGNRRRRSGTCRVTLRTRLTLQLRRYRALCSVEMLRTTWEKTHINPYVSDDKPLPQKACR